MPTNLICITCPRGCHLTVDDNKNVTGNNCPRGVIYALNELSNPTRNITTTIRVNNSDIKMLSVATSKPIPKGKIFDVVNEIKKVEIIATKNAYKIK